MADRLTPEARSRNMSRIRAGDTKPELLVRRLLHAMGYRFRLHRKDLPGRPDIVLPRHRAVIFVHGCFWHGHDGCKRASVPSTRREFWEDKIRRNRERDRNALARLKELGFRALTVWQCELKDHDALRAAITSHLAPEAPSDHASP